MPQLRCFGFHHFIASYTHMPSADVFLIATSFVSSFITAALGIGGGTLMLAVLTQVLPASAVIPVHGMVQLGSNFGRTLLLAAHVYGLPVLAFGLGALLGALLGGSVVINLPSEWLLILLGSFILITVWAPKFERASSSHTAVFNGGLVSTALTMFVGATGPLVLGLIRARLKQSDPNSTPANIVATASVCIFIQHSLKIAVFGLLGFNFSSYLNLLILMIGAGFVGTYFGKKILLSAHAAQFDTALKWLLTALALRIFYSAIRQLVSP